MSPKREELERAYKTPSETVQAQLRHLHISRIDLAGGLEHSEEAVTIGARNNRRVGLHQYS